MVQKKITRKVISKVSSEPVKEVSKPIVESETDSPKAEAEAENFGTGRKKKTCFFCQSKTIPSYTDVNTLRRFTTDRSKIMARIKSSLCSKHQRVVTRQIKYARHLSLLPFIPKV